MSYFRRRLMGWNKGFQILPDGYSELQYIESTAQQRIDTGIAPWSGDNTKIRIDGCFTQKNNYRQLFGVNFFWIGIDASAKFESSCHYFKNAAHTKVCEIGRRYKLELSLDKVSGKQIFSIDNIVDIESVANRTTPDSVFLFSINYSTPSFANFKMYSCEITQDGKVNRYIPCKSPNGEVGLFEITDGVFFKSTTSSPFIAGPLKNK